MAATGSRHDTPRIFLGPSWPGRRPYQVRVLRNACIYAAAVVQVPQAQWR